MSSFKSESKLNTPPDTEHYELSGSLTAASAARKRRIILISLILGAFVLICFFVSIYFIYQYYYGPSGKIKQLHKSKDGVSYKVALTKNDSLFNVNTFRRVPTTDIGVFKKALEERFKKLQMTQLPANVYTFDFIINREQQNQESRLHPDVLKYNDHLYFVRVDITALTRCFIVNSTNSMGLAATGTKSVSLAIHASANGLSVENQRRLLLKEYKVQGWDENISTEDRTRLEQQKFNLNSYIDDHFAPLSQYEQKKMVLSDENVYPKEKTVLLMPGAAMITEAGESPAYAIIHVRGPLLNSESNPHFNYEQTHKDSFLYYAYKNALAVADAFGAQDLAMPLISVGYNNYNDLDSHAAITVKAVNDYFSERPKKQEQSGTLINRLKRVMLVELNQTMYQKYSEELALLQKGSSQIKIDVMDNGLINVSRLEKAHFEEQKR